MRLTEILTLSTSSSVIALAIKYLIATASPVINAANSALCKKAKNLDEQQAWYIFTPPAKVKVIAIS